MEFVYILQSKKHSNLYVGWTNDIRGRLQKHTTGKVFSTKSRLPLTLIYYEAFLNPADAKRREKYLKTAWGKRYIKNRLRSYVLNLS